MLQVQIHRSDPQRETDIGYYTPIKDKVLRARADFLAWADSLPDPINDVVKKLSKSPSPGLLPDALLGERNAFLLGEIFQIDEEVQHIAALGCIAEFTYLIHQDHRVDEDEGEGITLHTELAQNFLYAKAIESFQTVARDQDRFWRYWFGYMTEYTDGYLSEFIVGRSVLEYSREDLQKVANRSAPAKICAASFALSNGREEEIPTYDLAAEYLALGLQIRDDIADCVDDHAKGKYTYVISRLLGNRHPTMNVLQRAALYTDTIENLIDESTQFLQKTSTILGLTKEVTLQIYLDHLEADNIKVKSQIAELKSTTLQYLYKPRRWDLPLVEKEEHVWHEIERKIQRIRAEY